MLPQIKRHLLPLLKGAVEYREPFFGGGSVGLSILDDAKIASRLRRFWINDIDPGIYALWDSVVNHPAELIDWIVAFRPSPGEFWRIKKSQLAPHNVEEIDRVTFGAERLALHAMSFSGVGPRSGGPIRPITSRWNPSSISRRIMDINERLARMDTLVTCLDFEYTLKNMPSDAVAYCDPPYMEQGARLYVHHFNKRDHRRLAHCLERLSDRRWLLSYDTAAADLYRWACIRHVHATYTLRI